MSLESHFNELLGALLKDYSKDIISAEDLIQCIDLTLLDEAASTDALLALKIKASQQPVAAVCVYRQHISYFLPDLKMPLATVINFPQGNDKVSNSLRDITSALHSGASEIDYVFPYTAYLNGDKNTALSHCEAVSKACKEHDLKLKIILETGAFPNQEAIYQVSKELISIGCDFIKTSTGKIPQGASMSAVFAILSAIKESEITCGIKISGGVKTAEQAQDYAKLASLVIGRNISAKWFRIGASSLLDDLSAVY